MFTKTSEPVFNIKDVLKTDHALILVGIGAALIALIYLLLG